MAIPPFWGSDCRGEGAGLAPQSRLPDSTAGVSPGGPQLPFCALPWPLFSGFPRSAHRGGFILLPLLPSWLQEVFPPCSSFPLPSLPGTSFLSLSFPPAFPHPPCTPRGPADAGSVLTPCWGRTEELVCVCFLRGHRQ